MYIHLFVLYICVFNMYMCMFVFVCGGECAWTCIVCARSRVTEFYAEMQCAVIKCCTEGISTAE